MGANIKVGAETKQFQQEMQRVTQDLRLMASELGVVTTRATLFGTEQQRLQATSTQLAGQIEGQTRTMDLQRQVITSITADVAKYRDRNNDLARSIADVESRLQAEIRANGEGTTQARTMQRELQGLQREYTSNTNAINRSEQQLTTYNIRLNETETELLQTERELQNTERDLRNINWTQAGERMEAFGNKAVSVGKTMTMAFTVPLTALATLASKNAIAMEDEMSKADVVFRSNSNAVNEWSKTLTDDFGIAELTAKQMSSTFGAMAIGMGISSNKATEMSEKLTELAGDLASFTGIRLDVAQTGLNAVFTGETESLKKMGIVMTQVNLQNYENVHGTGKRIDTMNEAEKTMLRYNFILEKTSLSQGDFERTGDSGANILRKFQETLKDLSVSFGTELLPVLKPVIKDLTSILKFVIDLSPAIKIFILTMGGVLLILGPVLVGVGKLVIGLKFLGVSFITTGGAGAAGATGVAVFGMSLQKIVIAIAVAVAAIGALFLAYIALKNLFTDEPIKAKIEIPKVEDVVPKVKTGKGHYFANGGIMTKATVFGMDGSNPLIGGEAGHEAILPLSKLWDNMDRNFNNLEKRLSRNQNQVSTENNQYSQGGDTFILNVDPSQIDEVSKMINVFNTLKQNKRQFA